MGAIRIIVAQVAARLGDVAANCDRACELAARARDWGADLIVFPELFLIGYPPEDLLFAPRLPDKLAAARAQLAQASASTAEGGSVDIVIGSPSFEDGCIYNSALHFSAGKLARIYHKQALPNYGVFDERRYFTPGEEAAIINYRGKRVMLQICEDVWREEAVSEVRLARADLVLTINASPFEYNKLSTRQALVSGLARQTSTAWLYVNLHGSQDDLIFDGASFCVDKFGILAGQAREMAAQLWQLDFVDGEWPQADLLPALDESGRIFQAIAQATRGYVESTGAGRVLIGLSGGVDSALCLALAVAALGVERVTTVIMPYIHTRSISLKDARKQAKKFGVETIELPIHQAVDGVVACLKDSIDWDSEGGQLAMQNIQARCRANLLMALANARGALALNTNNKAELAMGYGTLYGDMAGAYAPLKDLDKQTVYRLARWCNRDGEWIVKRIIDREPSAELAPDQLDSDTLPDYELLDNLVRGYIEQRQSSFDITQAMSGELITSVLTNIDRNEYKRRQAPLGPKITQLAFGRDRRMPIANHWRHGDLDAN